MENQRGNALFLILIAVALFAALSYAVTQSGRGGSGIDKEKVKLNASQLIQYFGTLDTAIQRMRLIGGYSIEEIDFRYDALRADGSDLLSYQDNPNCNDPECEVFNPLGGNVALPIFDDLAPPADNLGFALSNLHPGHSLTLVVNWTDAGTSANDIILSVIRLHEEVCIEINNMIGLVSPPVRTGTPIQANNVASWDNTAQTLTNTNASGLNFFGSLPTVSPSGVRVCDVYYKLFDR